MQEREEAESLQLFNDKLSNKPSCPGLSAADNRGQHQPVDYREPAEGVSERGNKTQKKKHDFEYLK